jgi:hypothetical protein
MEGTPLRSVYLRRVAMLSLCIGSALFWAGGAGANQSSATSTSADPSPHVTVTPIRPYHFGDKVWTSSPPVENIVAQPFTSGCVSVPTSGYIGSGVYANTNYHTTDGWGWSDSSSEEAFHWYIRRTSDGVDVANAPSAGAGQPLYLGVAYTTYIWKVQNLGADPQAWNVCWR